MAVYPKLEDFLIEEENIISTLREGNLTLAATDKRLIRYLITTEGIGVLDLSYDTITSINVFLKQLEKRYFWLSGIGVSLLILSVILKEILKVLSMEQQIVMFIVGIFLIVFGLIFKRTENVIGLGFFGNGIPKIKFDKTEINPWGNFTFRNKDFGEVIEFAKTVRTMVNYCCSFREVHISKKD